MQDDLTRGNIALCKVNDCKIKKKFVAPWVISMILLEVTIICHRSSKKLTALKEKMEAIEEMFPGVGYSNYERVINGQLDKIKTLTSLIAELQKYQSESSNVWKKEGKECDNSERWAEAIWDAWEDYSNRLDVNAGDDKATRKLKQYKGEIVNAREELANYHDTRMSCPRSVTRLLMSRGVKVYK